MHFWSTSLRRSIISQFAEREVPFHAASSTEREVVEFEQLDLEDACLAYARCAALHADGARSQLDLEVVVRLSGGDGEARPH
jgi:hypothetical protein